MRILFIGDVFGRPGRNALEAHLEEIKTKYKIDFCIANGENSAGGKGLNQKIAKSLFDFGIDCITMGNHTWDNKDILSFIDEDPRVVRACNYPPNVPGKGFVVLETSTHVNVVVTQILCRVFMSNIDCPFRGADAMLEAVGEESIIICDLHGEATSEKVALGWYLDGKVSAVLGTHTHIPTADERILPQGTAYITDVGMTGSYDSVIGMDIESVTKQFISSIRSPFKIAKDNVKIAAIFLVIDESTGKAESIERLFIPVEK
jgi:2',3'-cyclic-nucleotide 2'-phosphodiesterase